MLPCPPRCLCHWKGEHEDTYRTKTDHSFRLSLFTLFIRAACCRFAFIKYFVLSLACFLCREKNFQTQVERLMTYVLWQPPGDELELPGACGSRGRTAGEHTCQRLGHQWPTCSPPPGRRSSTGTRRQGLGHTLPECTSRRPRWRGSLWLQGRHESGSERDNWKLSEVPDGTGVTQTFGACTSTFMLVLVLLVPVLVLAKPPYLWYMYQTLIWAKTRHTDFVVFLVIYLILIALSASFS